MGICRTLSMRDLPRYRRFIRMETEMGNRYICSVLEEMRTCYETRNFAPIKGLIEECQTLANRMESAIDDKRDVLSYEQRRPILKDEIKELQWRKEELEEDLRKLEFKIKELKHDNKID